jgi:hypothetical protein
MQNLTFRTAIPLQKAEYAISHENPIMLMGSCFAESIGQKLARYKFAADINPFGVLYNPASIAQALSLLTETALFTEKDLFFLNNEWISFYHHGKFSHTNKEKCLSGINEKLLESREFLQKADFLILTLGSTVTYSYQGNIVANCHKFPQKEFQKQMLTPQNIVSELTESIEKVRRINEKIRIIFTVSPIRYIKNSMTENTLSKAQLIVATHELLGKISDSEYFPAYEIMMDDLRDYRFYNDDMTHPTPLAVNYIWNAFYNKFFSEETIKLNAQIEEIVTARGHRLKNPNSENSKRFKKEQLMKIEKIQSCHPQMPFEEEIRYFLS